MQIGSWIAIYFIIWWVCLFAVLPFRVRNQIDAGEVVRGTEPGAPVLPRLVPRLIANSLVSAVVMGLILWGLSNPWLQHYWH
ncbi:hypothetical protein GCM10011321_11860 [Youhaiella tibetensis]|uniref:DUF1467 family protein n=1 Tax=Paradevosia tibetensis TaxID=1447062 RepID=A0A5B9DMV6_9HYPH|nr:DUF1467 family protein [Youhaiella tibetensis]AKR55537.1 protein of unknown function DUF1467 [Devosia sp. H5989]QEE20670.1 DUF1467 family protein [Youhaiella tibetensis]GGF22104.1 hypothetical protein GCM10011321_11860 [Youhaiella tibetensis]